MVLNGSWLRAAPGNGQALVVDRFNRQTIVANLSASSTAKARPRSLIVTTGSEEPFYRMAWWLSQAGLYAAKLCFAPAAHSQ